MTHLLPASEMESAFSKLARMQAAFRDMLDCAGLFDGSFEKARDRFFAIKEGKA